MPIYKYSVLKGDPQTGAVAGPAGKPPHYRIPVLANGIEYQAAINIESDNGSEVLYYISRDSPPPNIDRLQQLPDGLHTLKSNRLGLDYVRSEVNGQPIVTAGMMTLLPLPADGEGSDNLKNELIQLLNMATSDPAGVLYVFGSQYSSADGIHDVHMNQGNPPGGHSGDDGIWQDGAALFQLPQTGKWISVFIAFQEQIWSTDDNGNPLMPFNDVSTNDDADPANL